MTVKYEGPAGVEGGGLEAVALGAEGALPAVPLGAAQPPARAVPTRANAVYAYFILRDLE